MISPRDNSNSTLLHRLGQRSFALGIPIILTILGFLTASIAAGQVQQESASSLIEFLTRADYARDQFGRRVKIPIGEELTHCSDRGNRGATVSLAKLGGPAIPALEKALDSIEKRGLPSVYARGAGWLSIVYARNMGPAAVPRLRRLMGNPKLVWFQVQLDRSVALALGLTSYVTETSEVSECRLQEPRDGLDRLTLGWKQNDRQTIENNLGPNARAALKLLLDGRDWEAMRAELWTGKSGGGSVGYRFESRAVGLNRKRHSNQKKRIRRRPSASCCMLILPPTSRIVRETTVVRSGSTSSKLSKTTRNISSTTPIWENSCV